MVRIFNRPSNNTYIARSAIKIVIGAFGITLLFNILMHVHNIIGYVAYVTGRCMVYILTQINCNIYIVLLINVTTMNIFITINCT